MRDPSAVHGANLPWRAALRAVGGALLLACSAGCSATWEERIAPVQQAFYRGDAQHAAELLAARLA
ncbi:MAG TPA: hypothetical protein VK824_02960, partial [Planctomycetota bacterium]|nr:hypothetical protein [Planctomycetota bacterium]